MRKDTLYITLSRDITSYTITSGQRAIATNVNYAVTIESPTLTTNLAGRDVSVIISDTEGNTLTTATTFYPDTKNPYKAVTGSLLLDGAVYAKFFDGKPVDTAVRLPIVIRDKSATLLSSDIVVMNGGENVEPSASDETVAGLVNAIRFYDLAEFKAWLDGTKTRDDGLRPTDIVVGQWVHTQQDGSFICKELIGPEPSVTKNFTAIVTQFPLTGTLKMNPDNGIGLSVYSGDVYNDAEATSYRVDAITYKGDAFTFTAGDNQIARQKDNYALENRVNSTMKSTLDAIKADNDETYAAMLPVRNETVEARDRAETAARGAKASETRAITAETNAATSEQNAEASKKSAAVSEANAGLYRQQALAYAQKAETEAATATTKATEASTSSSEASASAGEALAHKNDARGYAEAARLSAEASAVSADSSATSAAASRSSADTAAQSESIAVSSAAAAASSANTASEHKDAALSSATNAATSATNAATSATNAATSSTSASNFSSAASDSAKAAATSAADLAEAVATAESLDGRITLIEGGKGVYKASDGKIRVYTPLLESDGTIAVIKDLPNMQKIRPVDSYYDVGVFSDGRYVYMGVAPDNSPIVWVYDRNLKRVAKFYTGWLSGVVNFNRPFAYFNGERFYHKPGVIRDISGNVIKQVSITDNDGNKFDFSAFFYNAFTDHFIFIQETGKYIVLDYDLNYVLNDDGTKKMGRVDGVTNNYYQGVTYINDHCYIVCDLRYFDGVPNAPMLTIDENDCIVRVHESIPVVDDNGHIVFEERELVDNEGNVTTEIVKDSNGLAVIKTTEGRELKTCAYLDAEDTRTTMKNAKAYRGIGRFFKEIRVGSNGLHLYTDGVDIYAITADGKFIDWYSVTGGYEYAWPSDKRDKYRGKREAATGFTVLGQQLLPVGDVWTGGNGDVSCAFIITDLNHKEDLSTMQTAGCSRNLHYLQNFRNLPTTIKLLIKNAYGTVHSFAKIPGASWAMFGYPAWFSSFNKAYSGIL